MLLFLATSTTYTDILSMAERVNFHLSINFSTQEMEIYNSVRRMI